MEDKHMWRMINVASWSPGLLLCFASKTNTQKKTGTGNEGGILTEKTAWTLQRAVADPFSGCSLTWHRRY